MLTLAEIIDDPVIKKLKYLTDEKLLNNKVSDITVMEVPDTYKWLNKNSIVITSFYSFIDSEDKILSALEKLKRNGCTCIAIKTGEYLNTISESVINKANDLEIALFEIPIEVKYTDIISSIYFLLYKKEDSESKIQLLVNNLLNKDNDMSEETIFVQELKYYGLDLENSYVFVSSRRYDNRNIVKKFEDVSVENLSYRVINIENKHSFSDIIFSNHDMTMENKLDVVRYLKKDRPKVLGIGSVYKGLAGLRKSFDESNNSLEVSYILDNDKIYVDYRDLEPYIIIYKLLNNNDDFFETIDLSDELYQSLLTYYDCNLNIKLASSRLYIHENTLRYRLNKIKSISGYDPYDFKDNIILFLNALVNKQKKIRGQ